MGKMIRWCSALLLAVFCAHAAAQSAKPAASPTSSLKIGYVNVARIESESAMAKQATEMLRKEFAPREQQLLEMQKQGNALQADLEKNSATMPAGERQAKEKRIAGMLQQYQQMQRGMVEDLEVRKRESFAGFLVEVNEIIKGIAEAGNFDLIVQQAVFNSPQTDITEQVMKEIAKRTASTGK